ncbi:MAG: HEAT repeat domain-containing protein [Chloroflexota bacterium]
MDDSIPNIWLMQTNKDSAGLLAALHHKEAEVRRRAAVSLRIIGDIDAVDPLREVLEHEADPRVRVAVIAALDHLAPKKTETGNLISRSSGPQSRVERLIDHLMSNRPDAAVQAANALGDLGDKIAVPPLIVLFRNKRQPPSVRLAAAEALLKMDSAPAEVTLLAALRSEKWHLRRNGAAILGQLRADWAIDPLAEALLDDKEMVAKTAHAALRRIGTEEARAAMAAARAAARAGVDKRTTGERRAAALRIPRKPPAQDLPQPATKSALEDRVAVSPLQERVKKAAAALTKMDTDSLEEPDLAGDPPQGESAAASTVPSKSKLKTNPAAPKPSKANIPQASKQSDDEAASDAEDTLDPSERPTISSPPIDWAIKVEQSSSPLVLPPEPAKAERAEAKTDDAKSEKESPKRITSETPIVEREKSRRRKSATRRLTDASQSADDN